MPRSGSILPGVATSIGSVFSTGTFTPAFIELTKDIEPSELRPRGTLISVFFGPSIGSALIEFLR